MARCTSCNIDNEYQEDPYTCYTCRGGKVILKNVQQVHSSNEFNLDLIKLGDLFIKEPFLDSPPGTIGKVIGFGYDCVKKYCVLFAHPDLTDTIIPSWDSLIAVGYNVTEKSNDYDDYKSYNACQVENLLDWYKPLKKIS